MSRILTLVALFALVLTGCQSSSDGSDAPAEEPAAEAADATAEMSADSEAVNLYTENMTGEEYLAKNAAREGVMVTESGLQYEVLRDGDGEKPGPTSTVTVHYEGTHINGEVFDSSYARDEQISFPLNRVIPGWTEGLQLMPVGSKYRFVIPSGLAYGPNGTGPIGPNETLVFEVELFDFTN